MGARMRVTQLWWSEMESSLQAPAAAKRGGLSGYGELGELDAVQ